MFSRKTKIFLSPQEWENGERKPIRKLAYPNVHKTLASAEINYTHQIVIILVMTDFQCA